jgi:NO-binding membrane sensor protein with MHYT domain
MLTETVCMALSVAGLAIALLTAWRRRFRAALRWAAVALIPTGLWLTGLITVFRKIGQAIGTWAAHLVFDPKVWVGVVLLAVAVAVLMLTGVRRHRPSRQHVPAGGTGGLPTRTAPQGG